MKKYRVYLVLGNQPGVSFVTEGEDPHEVMDRVIHDLGVEDPLRDVYIEVTEVEP